MTQKILIVDDSSTLRMMMQGPLVQAGYEVIEAVDGIDALSKLEVNLFDLIITDLNMPNMNGIELVTKIREQGETKFTPIVMLTTEAGDHLKAIARKVGLTAWINKPFSPDKLLTVTEKILNKTNN